MSDLTLRQAERSGDATALLVEQMRAGIVSRDLVRLRAYLGEPVAREMAGYADCCLLCNKPVGFIHLPEHCTTGAKWASELPALMEPLPPRVHTGPCAESSCRYKGYRDGAIYGPCGGTHSEETPASRWLSVVGLLAVVRAVHEGSPPVPCTDDFHGSQETPVASCPGCVDEGITQALDACEAWVGEPSEAHVRRCYEIQDAIGEDIFASPLLQVIYHPGDSTLKANTRRLLTALPDARRVFSDAVIAETMSWGSAK